VSTIAATAIRPAWEQLPVLLRDGLDTRLGGITGTRTQTGGFTPGLAVRLQLTDGSRLFAKGIPARHVLAGKYRDEAATCRQLPAAVPAPRLRWDGQIAGWIVLIFDDIDGRYPALAPGSPDISRVVAMTAGLAALLTPCPVAAAPSASRELAGLVHGWRELEADPPAGLDAWTRRHLTRLAGLETGWLAAADGDTLLHGDINASNLLISHDQKVWLIDWAQPVRGAPWIDVADLVPHLILAGHTPAQAEQALAATPAWTATPPTVITSYATAFAGYWTRSSRLPAPPGVPRLRAYQARAAQAALTWTAHRTNWP
jgi:aminoglycoside phosphotransferase (APT) family kinase protein